MKTRHRKDMKKLSTAIRRGVKIAEENGITQNKGKLFKQNRLGNGEEVVIDCACALGMAYIGTNGLKATKENIKAHASFGMFQDNVYGELNKIYQINDNSKEKCLKNKLGEVTNGVLEINKLAVSGFVITLNDSFDKSANEIADSLEACGL